ncbi:MAG: HEPN domain-containing protein [Candidatus Heimdallarchaeota archaeon]
MNSINSSNWISSFLSEVQDHLKTAKKLKKAGNHRSALSNFQRAGEKAIKAFVLHLGVQRNKTRIHATEKILNEVPPSRRDSTWTKLRNLAPQIDNWGGYSDTTEKGIKYDWNPCKTSVQVGYGEALTPRVPIPEAIPSKQLEKYQRVTTEVVNIVFQNLRQYR